MAVSPLQARFHKQDELTPKWGRNGGFPDDHMHDPPWILIWTQTKSNPAGPLPHMYQMQAIRPACNAKVAVGGTPGQKKGRTETTATQAQPDQERCQKKDCRGDGMPVVAQYQANGRHDNAEDPQGEDQRFSNAGPRRGTCRPGDLPVHPGVPVRPGVRPLSRLCHRSRRNSTGQHRSSCPVLRWRSSPDRTQDPD